MTFRIDKPKDIHTDRKFIVATTPKQGKLVKAKVRGNNSIIVEKDLGQNTSVSEKAANSGNFIIKSSQNGKPDSDTRSIEQKLKPENHGKEPVSKVQNMYLFYQSQTHQYLLNRYGYFAHLVEVKPKHTNGRTTAFSLFLICVRTNVDCQVVGTILCNKYNDHTKVLKEALTEFKEINEFWKPKYLMIDPSRAIISVVEELFPGSFIFLRRFLFYRTRISRYFVFTQ